MCTFYSATNTGIPTLNSKILIFKFNYINSTVWIGLVVYSTWSLKDSLKDSYVQETIGAILGSG